jgi:DNA-binding response OmpR family regulator
MPDQDQASILAVGLGGDFSSVVPPEYAENCSTADSARSAIELLRMLRFDLVVTADRLPDMPVWKFVQRVRAVWPWQKWALASNTLDQRDEITARTLGVMSILETPVDWQALVEMANSIHQRAAHAVSRGDGVPAVTAAGSAGRISAADVSATRAAIHR